MKKLFFIPCAFLFCLLVTGTFQQVAVILGKKAPEPTSSSLSLIPYKKTPPVPGVITATITLSGTAPYGTHMDTCDLKYDKWGIFNFTQDDRGTGALDAKKVRGGGTASNGVTYTPLTYTDGCNVRGRGIVYTGTIASNSWLNQDSAGDWHFAAPFYMDWPQMAQMITAGWDIADHGAFHGIDQSGAVALGFNPMKNAYANRNYIFRQSLAQGVPYVTRYGVVPSADSGYQSAWEQMGYLGGTSENAFDNYTANPAAEYINSACAIVTNWKNDNRYKVQARQFFDLNQSGAVSYWETYINGLLTQSTSTVKNLQSIAIHAYDIASDKIICDYIKNNSNDHIMVCGLQEAYEYWECIWKTNITQQVSGNTITLTLDQRMLPDDMRWRDMSFKLKSTAGITITNVTVTGANDYSYNTTTGLVNIFNKKTTGFAFPPNYTNMDFSTGDVPLDPTDVLVDNNAGSYRDSSLHIDVDRTMLVDGNVNYQYHARLFDGAMLVSPYIVTIDLTDYGPTLDSFGVYLSGITGYTTKVVFIRNDNDVADTVGSFSSGAGWRWFKGPTLGKRYVVSRVLLVSTSTAGFGNEVKARGTFYPFTELIYPHRHSPLKNMFGVNTYVWDFINSFTTTVDPAKIAIFNTLGMNSARFYMNGDFYTQNGATWTYNPMSLGYYEENVFRRMRIDNPNIWVWNVLGGQEPQVKQSWRDNPHNEYQMIGRVTGYSDFTSFGTLSMNVFTAVGVGGAPINWRIENISRLSAPKQYPEGTGVLIPAPGNSVTFYIGGGLGTQYQIGDTVQARMVDVSQLNIMYANNTLTGRNTLTAWDSLGRHNTVYTMRRGNNLLAPRFIPFPGNNDSVGVNVANVNEPMNEPNASWAGFNDYLIGENLAYAWSKVYDNNRVWSSFVGVKNVDTSTLVSTSGLAINIVDAVRAAEIVSRRLRGYRPMAEVPTQRLRWKVKVTGGYTNFPADIIQHHNYSYTGGADQYASGINGGLPFELSPSYPSVVAQVWFRDKYVPFAFVDEGEWGYDIHQGSPINATAIGSHSIEQVLSSWAVATAFEYNVLGVDRAQYYRLYSYDSTATQFSTMSLLRYDQATGVFSRKMVGNYFAQLKPYGEFTYDTTYRNDFLRIYRFKNDTTYLYYIRAVENWTNEGLKFYGKPTFTERTGTYTLPLAGGSNFTMLNFQDEGTDMLATPGVVGPNGLDIDYGLKPILILSGAVPVPPPPIPPPHVGTKFRFIKHKPVKTF